MIISYSNPNLSKLSELIYYIVSRCEKKSSFGSTVLNKLLFYSDFYHYAKYGTSISETAYRKDDYGIVPSYLLEARGKLVEDGKIKIVEVPDLNYTQKRPVTEKPYEKQQLSDEQLKFVDEIIKRFGDLNATEISGLNHREAVFQYARYGEEIPFYMSYMLGDVTIPDNVMADAIRTAKGHGYKFAE